MKKIVKKSESGNKKRTVLLIQQTFYVKNRSFLARNPFQIIFPIIYFAMKNTITNWTGPFLARRAKEPGRNSNLLMLNTPFRVEVKLRRRSEQIKCFVNLSCNYCKLFYTLCICHSELCAKIHRFCVVWACRILIGLFSILWQSLCYLVFIEMFLCLFSVSQMKVVAGRVFNVFTGNAFVPLSTHAGSFLCTVHIFSRPVVLERS